MTEKELWNFRTVFNDGILALRENFDALDRKSQYWMGWLLVSLIGFPSYAFEQKSQLSIYFILIACSCWVCFLAAIINIHRASKLKIVQVGVRSFETDKGDRSLDKFLESKLDSEDLYKVSSKVCF